MNDIDYYKDEVHCLYDEKKELQARIDKAIEYIENNYDNATYTYSKDKNIYCKCFDELLDILKGSDSNE